MISITLRCTIPVITIASHLFEFACKIKELIDKWHIILSHLNELKFSTISNHSLRRIHGTDTPATQNNYGF